MIIVLKPGATQADADAILAEIARCGLEPVRLPGGARTVLGALGDERGLAGLNLERHPFVERVVERVDPILPPWRPGASEASAPALVARPARPEGTVVDVDGVRVGGRGFVVVGGPCAVESPEQMRATAEVVKAAGAHALRGGAFKPRTSPYSFQGLGLDGLRILRDVSRAVGLPCFTEVLEVADLDVVAEHAAALQVGARNMQNFRLLRAVGQSRKPVLLKRGPAATLDELLHAAEYVLSEGNPHVILCERGIRTFETATRNTLDLAAVPLLKQRTHLPVLVDPSHGVGIRDLVAPMALAAAACGADGLLVETHVDPARALSDGPQSLYPAQFQALLRSLRPVVEAVGRTL